MISRPILFSASMVRAILEGRKTQTRRVIKLPVIDRNSTGCELAGCELGALLREGRFDLCPYGQPSDQLWVKERFALGRQSDSLPPSKAPKDIRFYWDEHKYQTGSNPRIGKWRPSIFMPRWHSRITLVVTGVRVERLQDITERGADAEGTTCHYNCTEPTHEVEGIHRCNPIQDYRLTWEKINGDGSWEKNPWVWVVSFRRVTP